MIITSIISQKTDAELLQMFFDTNNNEYFGVLYNRYTPMIYGVCLKYLHNADDAQDAVIQIFENLLSKIEKYSIKDFRTWVYSVAKNYCLQLLRKKNVEINVDFGKNFMDLADISHLLNKHENEQQFVALEKCVEKLPEPQKNCITLFFIQEKSYADIVDETDYNIKSVKSYIQNGRRNLKICMEKTINKE